MWNVTGTQLNCTRPPCLAVACRELCTILENRLNIKSKVSVQVVCKFATYDKIDGFYIITPVEDVLTTNASFSCRSIISTSMSSESQVDELVAKMQVNDDLLKARIREDMRGIEEAVTAQIDTFLENHINPTCMLQKILELSVDIRE